VSSPRPGREVDHCTTPILFLDEGEIIGSDSSRSAKLHYGVFSTEKRVFVPYPCRGRCPSTAVRIGVPICEDVWTADVLRMHLLRERRRDPAGAQRLALRGRQDRRARQLGRHRWSKRSAVRLCQPGRRPGRIELDAARSCWAPIAAPRPSWRSFRERWPTVEFPSRPQGLGMPARGISPELSDIDSSTSDMLAGRDYVTKTGFPRCLIVCRAFDSRTAAVAADALGRALAHADDARALHQRRVAGDANACAEAIGHSTTSSAHRARNGCVPRDAAAVVRNRKERDSRKRISRASPRVTLDGGTNKRAACGDETGNKSEWRWVTPLSTATMAGGTMS